MTLSSNKQYSSNRKVIIVLTPKFKTENHFIIRNKTFLNKIVINLLFYSLLNNNLLPHIVIIIFISKSLCIQNIIFVHSFCVLLIFTTQI